MQFLQLYRCTPWTLTKCIEKKLDRNCRGTLRATLNTSRKQYSTKQQLYDHRAPISKTIKIRRTRHGGICWRNKDKLLSDVFLWIPLYGRTRIGRPRSTYLQQHCMDTGCSLEDLPGAMDDRNE